jgi:hypothetical protein
MYIHLTKRIFSKFKHGCSSQKQSDANGAHCILEHRTSGIMVKIPPKNRKQISKAKNINRFFLKE